MDFGDGKGNTRAALVLNLLMGVEWPSSGSRGEWWREEGFAATSPSLAPLRRPRRLTGVVFFMRSIRFPRLNRPGLASPVLTYQ